MHGRRRRDAAARRDAARPDHALLAASARASLAAPRQATHQRRTAGTAHLQALLANNLSRTKCCTWGLQTATALVKGGGGDAGCIARSLRSLTRCRPPATNTRTLHAAPVTPEEHHEEAATNYDTANTHPYAPVPQSNPPGYPPSILIAQWHSHSHGDPNRPAVPRSGTEERPKAKPGMTIRGLRVGFGER